MIVPAMPVGRAAEVPFWDTSSVSPVRVAIFVSSLAMSAWSLSTRVFL